MTQRKQTADLSGPILMDKKNDVKCVKMLSKEQFNLELNLQNCTSITVLTLLYLSVHSFCICSSFLISLFIWIASILNDPMHPRQRKSRLTYVKVKTCMLK